MARALWRRGLDHEGDRNLARNRAVGSARSWPLVDSLGQRVGGLTSDGAGAFTLSGTGVGPHPARAVRIRGRGCAASLRQQRRFPLVQVIAKTRPPGGAQAFIDGAALRNSPSGRRALRAFNRQRGGGTGCGPARKERGKTRPLKNPNVGATAHARLSNSVDEYDARPLSTATSSTSRRTRPRSTPAASRAGWCASARPSRGSTPSRTATPTATARSSGATGRSTRATRITGGCTAGSRDGARRRFGQSRSRAGHGTASINEEGARRVLRA